MQRLRWYNLVAFFLLGFAIAFTCSMPAEGAGIVTQDVALRQALTLTNGAVQSCEKAYAAEYPGAEGVTAIEFFMNNVQITIVVMPAELQARNTMAAVLPEASPKRIIVSQFFLGLMPPVFMAEVLVHEFIHLSDFNLDDEWGATTVEDREKHANKMAKTCMDALWRAYPDAKPPYWEDGQRPTETVNNLK